MSTETLTLSDAEADAVTSAFSIGTDRLGERVQAVATCHLAHGNASSAKIHAAVLAANPLATRISGYSSGSVGDALSAYGIAHDYLAPADAPDAYGEILLAVQVVRVKPLRAAWTAALDAAKVTAKAADATPAILSALAKAVDAAEAKAVQAKADAAKAKADTLRQAEAEAEAEAAALAANPVAVAAASVAMLADLAAMLDAVATLDGPAAMAVAEAAATLAGTAAARAEACRAEAAKAVQAEAVAEAEAVATPAKVRAAKARQAKAEAAKANA